MSHKPAPPQLTFHTHERATPLTDWLRTLKPQPPGGMVLEWQRANEWYWLWTRTVDTAFAILAAQDANTHPGAEERSHLDPDCVGFQDVCEKIELTIKRHVQDVQIRGAKCLPFAFILPGANGHDSCRPYIATLPVLTIAMLFLRHHPPRWTPGARRDSHRLHNRQVGGKARTISCPPPRAPSSSFRPRRILHHRPRRILHLHVVFDEDEKIQPLGHLHRV